MDYSTYTVEDFVADPSFVRWVKASDSQAENFWDDWIEQNPERLTEIEEAKALVISLSSSVRSIPQITPEELSDSKKTILEKIRANDSRNLSPPIRKSILTYRSLAAAIAVLITGSWALWWFTQPADQVIYQTDYGEIKNIVLPDQTRVTLNANSALKTPTQWDSGQLREVWLSGEAFFDVTHQTGTVDGRFLVHTDQLDVEVLGTQFNVLHRREQTQVVLTIGKVAINPSDGIDDSSPWTMEPGEMIQTKNRKLTLQRVEVHKYTSWRNGRLYFEEETLADIANRLKDNYGLQVRFTEPSLTSLVFTGSTPTDDLSILFVALSEALNIKITQEERLLLIQPKQSS